MKLIDHCVCEPFDEAQSCSPVLIWVERLHRWTFPRCLHRPYRHWQIIVSRCRYRSKCRSKGSPIDLLMPGSFCPMCPLTPGVQYCTTAWCSRCGSHCNAFGRLYLCNYCCLWFFRVVSSFWCTGSAGFDALLAQIVVAMCIGKIKILDCTRINNGLMNW